MERNVRPVGFANPEMAAAWDGPEGEHWVAHADAYEAVGAGQLERLLAAAALTETDRILDVGCGTGASTRAAARLASRGTALGVDLSTPLLAEAERRTASKGLTNVRFVRADAQVHPFSEGSFDVAISSMGTMFFADPVAAFANIGRALGGDGRLVVTTWRDLASNDWLTSIRAALAVGRDLPVPPLGAPGPFALADPGHVRSILEASGYADVELEPSDLDASFGRDAEEAYSFMASMGLTRGLTEALDDADRNDAFKALSALVEERQTPSGVRFGTAAWIITARRTR